MPFTKLTGFLDWHIQEWNTDPPPRPLLFLTNFEIQLTEFTTVLTELIRKK